MAGESWERTRYIRNQLARHQRGIDGAEFSAGDYFRIMKLAEEVGEVVQAYIGTTGANKRKGITHNGYDIASELSDVIITAMVAMHGYLADPEEFFNRHVEKIWERVQKEGS